ncbi:progesterone receptor [Pelodytes ibericus]
MDNKKQRPGTTSSPQTCPDEGVSGCPPRSFGSQVDLLQAVSSPSDTSLDSLLYQRPEDEDSYQKGEGPASSDNSEFQSVLDSILESSTPAHLQAWSDFIGPEITAILNNSPKLRTSTGHSPAQKEVPAWLEAAVAETKDIQDSMAPKGKDKVTKDQQEVNVEALAVKRDSYEHNHPLLPPGLNLINMPILSLNQQYLVARPRQTLDGQGGDQRPLTPNTSQHLVASTHPVATTKQVSYLHLEGQPDAKIKKEGDEVSAFKAPADSQVYTNYELTLQQANNPDLDQSLDFILYKSDSVLGYDSSRANHGLEADSPTHNLPSTSSTPQSLYQTLSLNGHQHLVYQSTSMKENYLPQIQLPYVQYVRADSDPDLSSPYNFEALPQKICLICGDEASGCHYGVLTCGSCKVFFKRAIEGQHNYLCAGRNDCIIDKARRKNCPSCRLRKCCQAGMVLGGRKFKKFSRIKTVRETDALVLQQPMIIPIEGQQVLVRRMSANSSQEIQYIPELLQILQSIEPEVVYAGYDNTQPETPSALLSSLNQLCERQLMCVVKWSKSLPGFRTLHIDDQITLLQYSWMSLMVFAMGWRSYKHVSGQMLYFAPDLILNEQRMKDSSFYTLCLSMWQLPQEFVKFQVSHEEFLCMKALLLLNTIPLEGLKSQSHFDEMRSNYIKELAKAIGLRYKGVIASSQRFYHLTKIMDSMHELVKQLHLYCLNTFLQSRALSVEFPEMMSEVISAQLPKILAGMVKPLVFHKK